MIKSNIPAFCDLRGTRKDIIQIEISSFESTPTGTNYVVNDYALSDDGNGNFIKQLINSKTVTYTSEKINALNEYLEANNSYSGMSKTERDWLKIKQGLLIDTQTNIYGDGFTIYKLNPSDWELS